jgi:malate/lactate dehydrogenase
VDIHNYNIPNQSTPNGPTVARTLDTSAIDILASEPASQMGNLVYIYAICESVIMDKNEVIPVSAYLDNYGVCLGWPSVVGANGIIKQWISYTKTP